MSVLSSETATTPLFLGGALAVIILIAFFSQGGKSKEEEAPKSAPKKVKASQSSSSNLKKKKKTKSKATASAAAAAPVEEKKEEEVIEKSPPVVSEVPKKKKKKKKSAASQPAQTAPTPAPEKVVSFQSSNQEDEDDESDDDDLDLWRIQASSKRNKKQTDVSIRAAANKEKERERALKKAEEEKKKLQQAEEKKAADEALAKQAELEAAAASAKAAAEKKTNGASGGNKTNGSSSSAAPPTTNGEAAATAVPGEKKKRKRKKKKPVDNDDGEPKSSNAAPVTHWETVPVVEEWQEVTHKSTKAKAKESTSPTATSEDAAAITTEPTSQEDGEISTSIPAGDDPLIFIGKGGATIQMLQDNTGAKFHLDRVTNQLTITGKEDAVERGLLEARSILAGEAERKANETTEKVTWGGDAIKAVIGRGGQNIRAAQEATGAKIDADVDAGTLVITGPREMVQAALTLCHNAAFGEAQDVMELGSRNAVNVVYGPNFMTIRGLQDETGCKLDIERGGTKLKLSGSVEAVAMASAKVRALLDANRGFEMTIENSKVGAVYGKGGETLRLIQDRLGVQIDVVRGPTHATVSVMGTKEASDKARRSLQRAIDGEVELGPGEIAEEIELGSATAAVIGRGGSNVTEMEKRHGVKINVRSDVQSARVVGKPDKVAAASKDILAIAKPILDAEKAQMEADEAIATGDSAWQVEKEEDDADGW